MVQQRSPRDVRCRLSGLVQILPPSDHAVEQGEERRKSRRITIAPHALRSHTVLLQGPLEILTPDSELLSVMDLASSSDQAVDLTLCW